MPADGIEIWEKFVKCSGPIDALKPQPGIRPVVRENHGANALRLRIFQPDKARRRQVSNFRAVETNGERNRVLHVLKSRGMAHSNQVREFLLTDHGIELRDVYVGPGAVLTGAAYDRLCLPAFHARAGVLVLPAFGEFTGLKVVRREEGDHCFVTDGARVLALP